MKILHVVPSYIQAFRYGGAVKAVHELCRALVQKGVQVLVITTDIDVDKRLDVLLNKPVDVDGVRVIYCPVGFMKSFCYSKDLAKAVRENIPGFDIVHIHSVYLYPTFITAYWCRRYRKPYLINPFGALDPSMIKLKSYIKKLLYIKLVERKNIEKASIIHVATNYEKERFESLGFHVPAAVVPRGLYLDDYMPPQPRMDLKDRYPQLKGKKVMLFLGRIHFKKGLDLLARAFKKVVQNRNDVYLVIAGPGEKGYTEQVKKLFRRLNLTDRVLFIGAILGSEKISVFYSSDIFVLTSYGENFGIAVLEAMACKLPVIITNRVGLYPDIEEYKAGLITDCNPDEIAKAIFNLLDNEELRRSMGENGKKLVEDKFVYDKVADSMIRLYRGALDA